MIINTVYSPVTLTFNNEKEWKLFREFLLKIKGDMEYKQNRVLFSKDLNPEEQKIYNMIKSITEHTELVKYGRFDY